MDDLSIQMLGGPTKVEGGGERKSSTLIFEFRKDKSWVLV